MNTQQATIGQEGAAIPGSRSWPMFYDAPAVEKLYAIFREDIVSWPQPGRCGPSRDNVLPISDCDPIDFNRRFTARNNTITRPAEPAVMAGLPRWKSARVAPAGIEGNLAAAPTSYTFAFLFKSIDIADHNGLLCVGPQSASRIYLFHEATGKLKHQHGLADLHETPAQPAGVWHAGLLSFLTGTRVCKLFLNTTVAPIGDWVKANEPPASTQLRFLGATNDGNPANAEMIPLGIWKRALHTDPVAAEAAMSSMVALKSLPALA